MQQRPSIELLQRSRSGDADALRELMARHLPGLRAFVRLRMSPLLRAHESASDVVQSTLLELLNKLDGFDYRGEAPFRGWLYDAVLRTLRDKERSLRAQRRDARRDVAVPADSAAQQLAACYTTALSPSQRLLSDERVRALEAAFDELPEDYREVISLSRIARLSRAQVAVHMQRSEDSVRNLLSRALALLAETLRKQEKDGEA